MIVATVVLLVATICLLPFCVKVGFWIDFASCTGKISIKVAFLRVFVVEFCLYDVSLVYFGTINGTMKIVGRSGKPSVKILQLVSVDVSSFATMDYKGIKYLSVANIVGAMVQKVLCECGVECRYRSFLGTNLGLGGQVVCRVSLLSLVGVGCNE